jgi:hypothetical protein
MTLAKDRGFDAAVFDRDKLPGALIQVKARPLGQEWTPLLRSELKRRPSPPADFLLAIDPVCIHLYWLTEKELSDPVVHLDTAKILSHYDSDFGRKRIFEHYLLTLVEAWLRDLAYHWKSPNPPGSEELKAAGFLGRVEGGTTQRPGA